MAGVSSSTGYTLATSPRHRVLQGPGGQPVAAARDDEASLGRLVPLSRFLALGVDGLKQAFLDIDGRPLLSGGRYV